jgi:putative phage-type endonuclease
MDVEERIKALIEKTYHDQRSDAWLAQRANMLTASDVATVIGVNPYETVEDVMYKKCGFRRFFNNTATLHGNKYEEEARDIYCERYGETCYEIGVVPHPLYPWLGGSPDGITKSGKLIEIKCPLTRKITGEVPKYYIPQVQLLMEILDLETCDFIQYRPPNGFAESEFVIKTIPRDREWFTKYLPVMKQFWDDVIERRKRPLCEIKC